jgi:hypothetical protein
VFASNTITEHVIRGVIGIAAFVGFSLLAPSHATLALPLIPVALIALRGCPMCWTMGLISTISAKLRGRSSAGLCTDGSCAIRRNKVANRQ